MNLVREEVVSRLLHTPGRKSDKARLGYFGSVKRADSHSRRCPFW